MSEWCAKIALDDFEVLHMANTGRVYTLIVKGDPKEAGESSSDRKSYHC